MELKYNLKDFISEEMLIVEENITNSDKYTPSEYNGVLESEILDEYDIISDNEELLKLDFIPTAVDFNVNSKSLSSYSSLKTYVVASYFQLIAALALVVFIGTEIASTRKGENLILSIATLAISIVTLILLAVSNSNYIDLVNGLDIDVVRKASLLASPIVILVMLSFLLVSQIVLPCYKNKEDRYI